VAGAKTNALRIIASLGVAVTTAEYPVGDEHLDAVSVARTLGVDPDRVWKTLVAQDEKGGALVFCIPGPSDLDLKKAARAAGVRSVSLLPLRDLTPLTGYVRGGCSPIGMKKAFPTWLDEVALAYDTIYVNAGARGLQMIIDPRELVRAANAGLADLV
jgi:Cys-tRNA(Pro)/Cys-tRNA(Cys) deacylase